MLFIQLGSIEALANGNYFNQTYHYLNPDSSTRTETSGIVVEIPNTGFLTAGHSWNYSTGEYNLIFTCTDYSGSMVSQKSYSKSNKRHVVNDVITVDSNFMVLGSEFSTINDTSTIMLLKIDFIGDTIWTKNIPLNEIRAYSRKIIQTTDGGYAIAGGASMSHNLPGPGYVIRTDSDGNTMWITGYADSTKFQTITSLVQLADGGFLATGWQSEGATNTYKRDIILVRLDSLGNQIWDRIYGSPDLWDNAEKIVESNPNEYLIIGSKALGPNFNENPNGLFINVDSSGNIIWQKNYGTPFLEDIANGFKNGQGFIAVGSARKTNSVITNGFLIQISTTGDSLWSRYYSTDTTGGSFDDYFWYMNLVSDGGYVMCGQAAPGSTGTQDAWVVRVDSMGCPDSLCLAILLNTNEHFKIKEETSSINIFPNPSGSQVLTFSYSTLERDATLIINNLNGEVVCSFNLKAFSGSKEILLPTLPSGIYIARILELQGIYTKLIIEN